MQLTSLKFGCNISFTSCAASFSASSMPPHTHTLLYSTHLVFSPASIWSSLWCSATVTLLTSSNWSNTCAHSHRLIQAPEIDIWSDSLQDGVDHSTIEPAVPQELAFPWVGPHAHTYYDCCMSFTFSISDAKWLGRYLGGFPFFFKFFLTISVGKYKLWWYGSYFANFSLWKDIIFRFFSKCSSSWLSSISTLKHLSLL